MIPMALRTSLRLPWLLVPVACLAFTFAGASANAQSFDATNLQKPADLGGVWLVHAGDDPAYARTDFDDSQWTRFDSRSSLKTVFPNSRPAIVWYRLHVKVLPTQTGLALQELHLSPAFEIYANGLRLMQLGRVAPYVEYTYDARLLAPIPDGQIAKGSLVIALRVAIPPSHWGDGFPGLYAGNLVLGQEEVLRKYIWLSVLGRNLSLWTLALLVNAVALMAVLLFSAQRRRTEYLWTFLLGIDVEVGFFSDYFPSIHNIPATWPVPLFLPMIAQSFLLVLIYFGFVRQPIWRWLWIYLAFSNFFWGCAVVGNLLGLLPSSLAALRAVSGFLVDLPAMFIIPAVLLVRLRRGNREAGILLIPLLLWVLFIYLDRGSVLAEQIPALRPGVSRFVSEIFNLHAGPIATPPSNFSAMLCFLSLAAIMVLRSNRISRQEAALEGELTAAREVQQVILPEQAEPVPGFKIESVYKPAQQVGGDFFQILPVGEGGLLVVVGDVAGKGLPAAMLVSVLVGAIRTAAAYSQAPEEVLAQLNERLIGRTHGGSSTALAAHISADGSVTVANAGHLSPYLDGVEVELPGALPLGIVGGASYEISRFHLAQGSRLTFYSDGVIEAQNQKGELFGFERGEAISTQPAAAIVDAAAQFGQSDDITVVAIQRMAAIA